MKITDKAFLKQILLDLRNMGFSDHDQSIDGSDAVEYLATLHSDLLKHMKGRR